jgi:enamine deaminase RidA (YjgF/YER057c/UK114 family)
MITGQLVEVLSALADVFHVNPMLAAGVVGRTDRLDQSGKSLAGDFEAQVRETFAFIERTLAQADAKLSDLVTMTVFLTDARNHPA